MTTIRSNEFLALFILFLGGVNLNSKLLMFIGIMFALFLSVMDVEIARCYGEIKCQ